MLFPCDKRRLISESVSPLDQQKKKRITSIYQDLNCQSDAWLMRRGDLNQLHAKLHNHHRPIFHIFIALSSLTLRRGALKWIEKDIKFEILMSIHTEKRATMKFISAKYSGVWASSTAAPAWGVLYSSPDTRWLCELDSGRENEDNLKYQRMKNISQE